MSQHAPLEGKKILVTGPTGQVALPLTRSLAANNDVWGIARFSNAKAKAELEACGVTCVTGDLVVGDFSDLPDDFDYVLNLAVSRASEPDFDLDLKANAESAGLLMSHCRSATAFFHCSTTGVYEADGHTIFSESSPLGDNHRCMMPTYSIAKIAAEAVVRYAARQFDLPTIIARLNTPYGNNGGWMYYHLEMMKNEVEIPVHSDEPSLYTPFHEDDILATLPGMFAAASVPARVVNWCGQEQVSIEEWCGYMGELTGLEPKFNKTSNTLESVQTDNSLMRELAGEAKVHWRDGIRRMVEARRPEYLL
jgi:nucleoside-diphosphate-sugar epimerase